jgi:hypothetical protein
MARRNRHRLGDGARCSVLLSKLRPSERVDNAFPNSESTQRLDDLVALRRQLVTRRGLTYDAIFFSSASIPDVELSAARRFVLVLEEGPNDGVWEEVANNPAPGNPSLPDGDVDNPVPIDDAIFNLRGTAEDIAMVRNQGFDVDDDNEPVPENVPTDDGPTVDDNNGLYEDQTWGWDGIDRRANNGGYEEPSFTNGWTPINKSFLDLFLHAVPYTWLTTVMMSKTMETMRRVSPNCNVLRLGEFLRYLGIRLLMSTCIGWTKEQFWRPANEAYDQECNHCPYNLRTFMSKRRFDLITKSLTYTDAYAPIYRDKYWQVRQMLQAFNANMASIFSCSWVICLDESMSIWHNKFTCPGWIYCPRKPHPYGNEYHTASCGKSHILFSLELVEGKDHPPQLQTEFDNLGGKTVGLLLRMLKSYFATGKYVVLDSGFCVLKGIVELRKRGLFSCALIKKRRYWPTLVPGDTMQQYFEEMDVGDTDAVSGTLDGVPYNIWGMKEPDYVMKMMATGGALLADDTCKEAARTWKEGGVEKSKKFNYTKPIDWHFKYRHAVDDHNNLRHGLPAIEDSWRTVRWENRVFSFLLAVCEINSYLFLRYFKYADATVGGCPTLLNYRRALAWELIHNRWLPEAERVIDAHLDNEHTLERAPKFVRIYRNRAWECTAMTMYQQYRCRLGCRRRIRTFCACSPGVWMCAACHVKHCIVVNAVN